jgi:glycosyltransferase involved in cell wall biosynthesis
LSETVLNVSQNYHIKGGSDSYFFSLSRLLESRGHAVIPFAAKSPLNFSTSWESYFPDGVDFTHPGIRDILHFIYYRKAAQGVCSLVRDHEIDIAHLHIYYGKLTTSILGPLKRADIPVVQTLHEYRQVCPVAILYSQGAVCEECRGHAFWHAVLKRCNRGSLSRSMLSALESYISRGLGSISKIDHFIAVSDFLRNKVIELGMPAERITTIHNFIDISGIPASREAGGYFLYFGRLEREKGLFTLLEAAASLKEVPLLVVGDGKAHPLLEAFVEKNSLNHVKFLGFKKGRELDELIRNSICTIVPSEWFETFGLTIIESFARGRPVIASSIGGMTEVVSDGVDGFLVPPGNVDALREKMNWMLDHRNQAVEMGTAGRKKAETDYSADIHYEKIAMVYKKVLSYGKRPAASLG